MDETRLDNLLHQYQELLDDGHVPVLDELCRDCPDLRAELGRRVGRLHKLGQILGEPAPPEPELLSLSDDKTWVSGAAVRDGTALEIPAPPGYEVIEPLGEGGMGVVYKARQLGLDRLVALKMILGGVRARAIDLARFREESRAIAALHHPNIVQIHEVGEFRRQPFFSLEFCAGGTLARAINGQPRPPLQAAHMAEVLARAIQSAHEKNIIHRDLKPGNVLLSVHGEAPGDGRSTLMGEGDGPAIDMTHDALLDPETSFKITDFGLAKRVDDDSGRTVDGSVMGTPSYMAPEQARGDSQAIGPLVDVWALGAVLYELLTGRPPFRGSTVIETLEQVRTSDPVPVRQLQPKVPVDLETICLKCLQKDPRQRYPSALALADDLKRFRTDRPIQARAVGQMTRAYRWCRREPRTAGLLAGILLLAAILPAILVGLGSRLAHAEERLSETQRARIAADEAERSAYRAGQSHRYFAGVSAAARMRAQPYTGWTWDAQEQLADAAQANTTDRDPVVIRSEMASAFGSIDLRRIAILAEGQLPGAIAFDRNRRIAIAPQLSQPVGDFRFVSLIDLDTKVERRLPFSGTWTLKYMDLTTALTFSPDGRWLFLGLRSGTVMRWDLNAADPARTSWDAHKAEIVGIVCSPDLQWVYTASHDGQVKRWPIAGNDKKAAAAWPEKPTDPKGKHRTGLAFWDGPRPGILVHGPGGAKLLDPLSLAELQPTVDWVAPTITPSPGLIIAHPNTGTVIVQRGADVDVVYWDRGICQTVARLRDPILENGSAHTDVIECLALHPSGMLLATVCAKEGLAKLWDLAAGDLVASIPAASGRAVAFSADGRTLAIGGDHITTLYEVGGLREQTLLGRRGFPIRSLGRTADGHTATIAAHRPPNVSDRASTVASVWNADGTLRQTVIHQADGRARTNHYQISASPASGWTAFRAGDEALAWLNQEGTVAIAPADFNPNERFDLSLDASGRAWTVEGGDMLRVRNVGGAGKARQVAAGWSTGGRGNLSGVRAAADFLVVGCDNAYLRVVYPDGGPVRECACFVQNSAALLTDRANTVRVVDVTNDNTKAIAGTEDGHLWLVSLPDAQPIAHWQAHTDRVTAVAFDRGGEWLASAGRDREVRLWKRSVPGYELYLILRVGRPVRQLLFTNDGTGLLVLREGETAVRFWHLDELHKRFADAGLAR